MRRRRASRRWRLATLATLALAGCGDDRPVGLTARADQGSEHVPVDAAVAAAADIGAWGCGPREHVGSGSFLDDDLVITAAHVVAGSDDLRVIDGAGRQSEGTVVHFDPDLDLALVRTTATGRALPLRADPAAAGDRGVVALLRREVADDALAVDVELLDVEVIRTARVNTTDIYLDQPVQRAGFEIDAAIGPGDSGAVVVLPGGGAGIVWAQSNQRAGRAWANDLPPVVTDPEQRAALTGAVDTGPCRD